MIETDHDTAKVSDEWATDHQAHLEGLRVRIKQLELELEVSDALIKLLQEEIELLQPDEAAATPLKVVAERQIEFLKRLRPLYTGFIEWAGLLIQNLLRICLYLTKPLFWLVILCMRRLRYVFFPSELKNDINTLRNSELFDGSWYLETYADLRSSTLGAEAHYLLHGASEGRDPSPRFSTSQYFFRNPSVKLDGINPLLHHLKIE